jgi:hypothetical protein
MPHLQQQSLPISTRKPVNMEKRDINPPWACQDELSKKAQHYHGYNGLCFAPIECPLGL